MANKQYSETTNTLKSFMKLYLSIKTHNITIHNNTLSIPFLQPQTMNSPCAAILPTVGTFLRDFSPSSLLFRIFFPHHEFLARDTLQKSTIRRRNKNPGIGKLRVVWREQLLLDSIVFCILVVLMSFRAE